MREQIMSVRNRRLLAAAKLSTARGREEADAFLAEGEKLVREALTARLVREVWADGDGLMRYAPLISEAEAQDIPVLEASRPVLEKLTSSVTPQGIAAVCAIPRRQEPFFRENARYAAAEDLQDPGNVGALVRAADAFALDGVLLVGACADLYNPKTIRATMGSLLRVPVLRMRDAAEALAALREKKLVSFAAVLSDDSLPLGEAVFPPGCAVWIGSETAGLRPETYAACEHRVKIPMPGGAESLNAAQAAAILLWELSSQSL